MDTGDSLDKSRFKSDYEVRDCLNQHLASELSELNQIEPEVRLQLNKRELQRQVDQVKDFFKLES